MLLGAVHHRTLSGDPSQPTHHDAGGADIRPIGATLLELTQTSHDPLVISRTKAYLSRTLDVLALLDSQVLDELGSSMRAETASDEHGG